MTLMSKENAHSILIIIITVFVSYSLPRLPYIGPVIEKYPWLVLAIGVILLIYMKKIVNFLGG